LLSELTQAAHPSPHGRFLPRAGAVSVGVTHAPNWRETAAAGYRICGRFAVRFDAAERLSDAVHAAAELTPEMARLVARPLRDLPEVLRALGFRHFAASTATPAGWVPARPAKPARRGGLSDGPFAPLAELLPAKPARRRRKRRPA
jgi:hypothetical protein